MTEKSWSNLIKTCVLIQISYSIELCYIKLNVDAMMFVIDID